MEKLKKYKYVIVTAAAAAVIAAATVLCGIFGRDVGISSESAAESSSETISTYTLRSETIETTPPPIEQSTATDTSTPAQTAAQTISAASYETTTVKVEHTLPQTVVTKPQTTTLEPQTVVTKPQTAPPVQASDAPAQTVVTKPQTVPTKPQTVPPAQTVVTKPQTSYIKPQTTKPQTAAATPQTAPPAQTEPQYQHYCSLTIDCSSILDNMDKLDKNKVSLVPKDGIIYSSSKVGFNSKESVFDILKRVCRENGIALESSYTPAFGSSYIEGINNLYEFDCGSASGWLYRVNGNSPGAGCSSYFPKDGDRIEFIYTCTLGEDVNGGT